MLGPDSLQGQIERLLLSKWEEVDGQLTEGHVFIDLSNIEAIINGESGDEV